MANPRIQEIVQRRVKRALARQQRRDLLDPNKKLSGRNISQAARQLARIEHLPAIRAAKTAARQSRKAERREVKGINRLGEKQRRAINKNYEVLGAAAAEQQQGLDLAGSNALAALRDTQDRQVATNTAQQNSVLGDMQESLAASNVEVGGSAGRQALADSLAQENAINQAGMGAAANTVIGQNAAANSYMGLLNASNLNRRVSDQNARREAVTDRRADVRDAYRDERMGIRSDIRSNRALMGATRVKNILELRQQQQQYLNELRALRENKRSNKANESLSAAELAETARSNKADERLDAAGGVGGSDSSIPDTPGRLTPPEWRQAAAAARNAMEAAGGRPKTNQEWQALANEVESAEGISWTPAERRQFIRRAKKRWG